MIEKKFILHLLPERYAVCQFPPQAQTPSWIQGEGLTALVRTGDELSIVCRQEYVPDGITSEREWRVFKVQGPFDFSQIGVLANLSSILAQARVSIFALSTFDTDYLLIQERNLTAAINALEHHGHRVLTN